MVTEISVEDDLGPTEAAAGAAGEAEQLILPWRQAASHWLPGSQPDLSQAPGGYRIAESYGSWPLGAAGGRQG